MRLVIFSTREERFVAGDERQPARVGEIDERGFHQTFGRQAMALQLDIEPIAENLRQQVAAGGDEAPLPGDDRGVERPPVPPVIAISPWFSPSSQASFIWQRLVWRSFQEGAPIEPHQAAVTLLARGEEHDTRPLGRRPADHPGARPGVLIAEVDRERAADNRLDAIAGELFREFERTEHIVGVGERQRRLPVGFRQFGKARDRERALQQRIGGMYVQMHKAWISHQSLANFAKRSGRLPPVSTALAPPGAGTHRIPRVADTRISVGDAASQRGKHLRPDRDHPQEQRQRGKSGGLFKNFPKHRNPP